MTKHALKQIEEQNFRELKQKVAADEKAGILDENAKGIGKALEELGVWEQSKLKASNTAGPLPGRLTVPGPWLHCMGVVEA